jgi:hypothetical protein
LLLLRREVFRSHSHQMLSEEARMRHRL